MVDESAPTSPHKRRRALLAYQRRHRRGAVVDILLSAADQLELENTIRNSIIEMLINKSVPLWAWLIWTFMGTVFYVCHDGYDWMIGFYISVNIGNGIGWGAPFDTPRHNDAWSKIFSSLHVTIGQIFVGISVLYIAEQLMEAKESWIISVLQKKSYQLSLKPWWFRVLKKLTEMKIVILLILWIGIGIIFGATAIDGWNVGDGADFVLSTLAKCGYRKIPNSSAPWKFFFVGIYSFLGIPLTVITLGIVVSFALAGSEERSILENIMVAVTPQELEVMKSVGIGVNENVILKQDFIVLMVVRIGAAHPDVIVKINERFKTLDRKQLGKISYDDIVFRGRDIMRSKSETMRKIFIRRVSSIISPQVTQPMTTMSSGIRNTFYRATKRASTIFPSSFRPFPARVVEIDQHYQASEDSKEENDDDRSPYSPVSDTTSKSFSKFQLSFSHSGSRIHTIPESIGELTPSHENREDGQHIVTDFEDSAIQDFEVQSDQSDQLDGIQEIHEEEEESSSSSSSSDSESEKDVEAQIQPDFQVPIHTADQGSDDGGEAQDEFPHDPQTHHRQRRKPVRISRALRHQLEIKKEKELLSTMNLSDKDLLNKIKEYLLLRLRHSHFLFVAAWMFWLLEGALFYTVWGKTSFYQGYFMSVTVGHSLFWAEPNYDSISKAFSVFHLLVGAILISCSLSIIARHVVESKKLWYVEAIRKQAILEALETEEIWDDVVALAQYWGPKFFIPVMFLAWETLGVLWSCFFVKWSFADAVYFVASGLTGGGMWLIPESSPSWFFFFTGVYVTFGAPIMAIVCVPPLDPSLSYPSLLQALGQFADILINLMTPNYDLEEQMKARVTDEELEIMKACGIEDGDGFIDASEFVILILVRIHAVNPELISVIEERFVELDADNSGTLSYEELTLRTTQILSPPTSMIKS